jgi:DNA-binding NtrC family response regulator
LEALTRHSWPGNVRELRNVVERALILSQPPTLRVRLPRSCDATPRREMTLEAVQRRHILEVLEQCSWRVRGTDGAAEVLGVNPATLDSRMKKLGIRRPRQRCRVAAAAG